MAISIEEYEEIFRLRSGRNVVDSPGDEGFELSAEDEKILDQAWAELRKERQNKNIPKRDG